MLFDQAQQDMSQAYADGGTGILTSGIVWAIAAGVSFYYSPMAGMASLFFGGMLIFPLAVLLAKGMGCKGSHQKHNPLGKLAIETTVLLFVGLFTAFCVAQIHLNWFFPIILMVIGARYLLFQTIYGVKTYWLLGGLLIATGAASLMFVDHFSASAFIGAIIELIFAVVMITSFNRKAKHSLVGTQ